ncbi:MAG: uL30 family ribosomal protein [Thermoanaerobaculia bacterium]
MRITTRAKTLRLKQVRSAKGTTREMREALKALGLGKRFAFSELRNTPEVRRLIAKVPHLISLLDGPDILFPREKSTLGIDRIIDAVEAVRAARK